MSYCQSCADLESERDRLLATLATERDEFGKKEIELKAALADAIPLHEMDAATFEINKLKAELAKSESSHIGACVDRDAYKSRCARLQEALEVFHIDCLTCEKGRLTCIAKQALAAETEGE